MYCVSWQINGRRAKDNLEIRDFFRTISKSAEVFCRLFVFWKQLMAHSSSLFQGPDGLDFSAGSFQRSEWECLRPHPGFRLSEIGEIGGQTQWNSSHVEDALNITQPFFFACGSSSVDTAPKLTPFSSGLQSTSVDENDVWLQGQQSSLDDCVQGPFLQHLDTSREYSKEFNQASASLDVLAESRWITNFPASARLGELLRTETGQHSHKCRLVDFGVTRAAPCTRTRHVHRACDYSRE